MKLNHIDTNLQELSRAEAKEITGGNEAPTFAHVLGYATGWLLDTFIYRVRGILAGTDPIHLPFI